MKKPTSKTQFKLNDKGVKSLHDIYGVLLNESPYLKLSWSDLISEIVTSMKENYLEKELSYLKLKFFDKKSYLKQAALNDDPTEDVIKLLKEHQEAVKVKNLKPTKKALKTDGAHLTKESKNAETA